MTNAKDNKERPQDFGQWEQWKKNRYSFSLPLDQKVKVEGEINDKEYFELEGIHGKIVTTAFKDEQGYVMSYFRLPNRDQFRYIQSTKKGVSVTTFDGLTYDHYMYLLDECRVAGVRLTDPSRKGDPFCMVIQDVALYLLIEKKNQSSIS